MKRHRGLRMFVAGERVTRGSGGGPQGIEQDARDVICLAALALESQRPGVPSSPPAASAPVACAGTHARALRVHQRRG